MMDAKEILALPMEANDSCADTVKGYLKALLRGVIEEGEGFSGKRPFGNSGWEYELYLPLVKAKAVEGKLSKEGYIEDVDEDAAQTAILSAIEAL